MNVLTLFRKPAYPPRSLPSKPDFTPSRMSPQKTPVASRPFDLLSFSFWLSSKWTVDVPPMSASHPVANCSTSSCELNVNSVRGARDGASAPCMRSTSDRQAMYIERSQVFRTRNDRYIPRIVLSRIICADLLRYRETCDMAVCRQILEHCSGLL